MQSLWMLAAAFLFSVMAACSKLGSSHFGSFELVFYRSLFGVITLWVWATLTNRSLATHLFSAHIKRSFLGTLSLTIWFFVISQLPLGTAMTLNYTNPLYIAFFVSLLAWRQKQPLSLGLIVSILIGFVGVVLVLKPELHPGQELPGLIGLSCGLFSALAYMQVKELAVMKEPEWRIVFYFTGFGTVWGLAGAFLVNGGLHPVQVEDIPVLLGLGASATLAQICMTRAWGAGNTLLTSVFQYSAIIFATVIGIVIFDESVNFMSILGISTIVVAGVLATWFVKRKRTS